MMIVEHNTFCQLYFELKKRQALVNSSVGLENVGWEYIGG